MKQQANVLLEFMPVACMPEHQEEAQVLQRKIMYALQSGPGNYLVQTSDKAVDTHIVR